MSSIKQHPAVALGTRAAAAYLSVSEAGMHRWRLNGRGPTYSKLGARTVRYRIRDLDAFLESHAVSSLES